MNCHEALLAFFSIAFGSGLFWSHTTSTYDFQEIGGKDLPGSLNIAEMSMAFLTLVIGTLTFFGAWCDCPLLQKNLYISISGFYGICCATVLAFLITRATLETQECNDCPLSGMDIKRRDECIINETDWSNKENYLNKTQCWYFACNKVCVSRHPKIVTSITLTSVSIAIYAILTLVACVCLHDKHTQSTKETQQYGSVALRQDHYSDSGDELVIIGKKNKIPKKFVIDDDDDDDDDISDNDDDDKQPTAV